MLQNAEAEQHTQLIAAEGSCATVRIARVLSHSRWRHQHGSIILKRENVTWSHRDAGKATSGTQIFQTPFRHPNHDVALFFIWPEWRPLPKYSKTILKQGSFSTPVLQELSVVLLVILEKQYQRQAGARIPVTPGTGFNIIVLLSLYFVKYKSETNPCQVGLKIL